MFVHLQTHTEYSLIDGLIRIDDLIATAQAMEMPAVAICDQANLYAMVKFYKAAMAAGIKPIIGSDLYIENPANPDEPFGTMLFCQNHAGYKNITKLISKSYLENQINGKPVVKRTWLQEYNAGLIAIANSLTSEIAKALLADQSAIAGTSLEFWRSCFPNRFYMGISRTGKDAEEAHNHAAIKFAASHEVPLVAANYVCFLQAEDFEAHEARVCIHGGYTLDDQSRARNYTRQQFFRPPQEMQQLFKDIPQAVINSVQIAQRCNLVLDLSVVHLPKFPVPKDQTP